MLKKNLHDKIMVSYTFAANTYDIIIEIIYTALFHILVLKCFNTHYYLKDQESHQYLILSQLPRNNDKIR